MHRQTATVRGPFVTLLVLVAASAVGTSCASTASESVSSPSAAESPSTTIDPSTTVDTSTTNAATAPTTNAPTPSPLTGSTPGVAVAYDFECRDGFNCTQFAEAPSGAIIAASPDGTSLRRYGAESVIDLEIELPDGLAFGSGAALFEVGPDDVAYLAVDQVPSVDPIQDVLAVPTTGRRAGEVVASWADVIDGSGDTDYAPNAEGLIAVGCCSFDPVRPDPAASPVITWIDSMGEPTTSNGPFATVTTDTSGNTLSVTDGNSTSTFPLPVFAQRTRGMTPVQVLDDGSVLMETFEMGATVITRYQPHDDTAEDFVGAGETIVVAAWSDPESEARPFVLEVLRSGDLLAVVDGDLRLIALDELAEPGWNDTARSQEWAVTADGLNEFIDLQQPSWATDPYVFGAMLNQNWYPNEVTQVEVPDAALDPFGPDGLRIGATGKIVITTSGFLDDSVEASQWTITVEVADDGLLRFISGSSAQRCQPGRGHQDFQRQLCI